MQLGTAIWRSRRGRIETTTAICVSDTHFYFCIERECMQRRTVLTTGGAALAGLSGCLGGTDGSGNSTPTPSAVPTWTQTDVGGLTLGIDRIQMGVVGMGYPDSASVLNSDRRYVYLNVEAVESAPARDSFGLETSTQTFSPLARGDRSFGGYGLYRGWESAYGENSPRGWLLFELPESADASDATVRWPGGEWEFPERARERLSTPPSPVSVDFSGPDTETAGSGATLTISVTNAGDQPRRFPIVLNQSGPLYTTVESFAPLLAGGERRSIERFVSLRGTGAGSSSARYTLSWAGDHAEVTVDTES